MTQHQAESVLARIIHEHVGEAYEKFGRVVGGVPPGLQLEESAVAEAVRAPLQDFYALAKMWLKETSSLDRFAEEVKRSFLRRGSTGHVRPQVLEFVVRAISDCGSHEEYLTWAVITPLVTYWRALSDFWCTELRDSSLSAFGQGVAEWITQIPLPLEYRSAPAETLQDELRTLLNRLSKYPKLRAQLATRLSERYGRAYGLSALADER